MSLSVSPTDAAKKNVPKSGTSTAETIKRAFLVQPASCKVLSRVSGKPLKI